MIAPKLCPLKFKECKGYLCAWYVFHGDLGQCVMVKLADVVEANII